MKVQMIQNNVASQPKNKHLYWPKKYVFINRLLGQCAALLSLFWFSQIFFIWPISCFLHPRRCGVTVTLNGLAAAELVCAPRAQATRARTRGETWARLSIPHNPTHVDRRVFAHACTCGGFSLHIQEAQLQGLFTVFWLGALQIRSIVEMERHIINKQTWDAEYFIRTSRIPAGRQISDSWKPGHPVTKQRARAGQCYYYYWILRQHGCARI